MPTCLVDKVSPACNEMLHAALWLSKTRPAGASYKFSSSPAAAGSNTDGVGLRGVSVVFSALIAGHV